MQSDQLTKLINQSRLPADVLSKEMREDVCSYINEVDMRLLINVYNRILTIQKQTSEIVYPMIGCFSLIVYKNLFQTILCYFPQTLASYIK